MKFFDTEQELAYTKALLFQWLLIHENTGDPVPKSLLDNTYNLLGTKPLHEYPGEGV